MTPSGEPPFPSPADRPAAADGLRAIGGRQNILAALVRLAEQLGVGCPARVVRVDRDRVAVTDGCALWRTDPDASLVDDPETHERGLPAVGDWLVISRTDPPGVLALGPRHGSLIRRDPGEARPQILATGVDVAIVTVACDRPPNIARVERELVAVFDAGAVPVIALTKADLVAGTDVLREALRLAIQDLDVVAVRSLDAHDDGVRHLVALVRSLGTGVLLGPSGAGKSTLTNAMVGEQVRATTAVRAGDSKGRHLTATRALVPLPGGGALIDIPGLRALGLWDAERGLDLTFSEITAAAASCRFLDCSHTGEPGCAVTMAVDAGAIDAGRVARYRALYAELVDVEEERTLADRQRRRRADRRADR